MPHYGRVSHHIVFSVASDMSTILPYVVLCLCAFMRIRREMHNISKNVAKLRHMHRFRWH